MINANTVVVVFTVVFCQTYADNPFAFPPQEIIDSQHSLNATDISQECRIQVDAYYKGLLTLELWAWRMYDSKTKFPSGVLWGNFFDLGNFDECLSIDAPAAKGKYCVGTIPLPADSLPVQFSPRALTYSLTIGGQVRTIGNDPKFTGIHFAMCMPDKCTTDDAEQLFTPHTFHDKYCYTKETAPKLTWGPITTIVILGVFLIIVILSTGYDIILQHKGMKPGNDMTVAFSYFSNGRKILSTTTNPDQLLCLNGLKVLSMVWVIICHEYVNGSSGAVNNYIELMQFFQDTANMFIMGGTLAVDTFFVIGGLVTVYTYLKATAKGVQFNILLYYIHRYIRLTPAIAIVVLIHATLLKHLGDGPLWNSFDDHLVEACRKHWWAALLYIQNYVHDEQACVPQSWYLSIDMQLFILSPLVLLPLKTKPKLTMIGLGLLTILGIVGPFLLAYYNELRAFMITNKEMTQNYMFSYYEQTYGRFGAYVIGMILGYLVYKFKNGELRVKWHPLVVMSLWTISLGGLLACVYAGHSIMLDQYNVWSHSLYIAFSRPAWSLAISGVIFACVTGHGGPINSLLSASLFQVFAKLSYAVYLVHYAVILVRVAAKRDGTLVTHFLMAFNFWGDLAISVVLALILCLTFESPMITIEKILFSRANPTKKKLQV